MADETEVGKVAPTFRGEWLASASYVEKDTVILPQVGEAYMALVDNKGVRPGTDENTWGIIAKGKEILTPPTGGGLTEAEVKAIVDAAVAANDTTVVHKAGDETVDGEKTFVKPINGSFITGELAAGTDLYKYVFNKSGTYLINKEVSKTLINAPFNGSAFFLEVSLGIGGKNLASNVKLRATKNDTGEEQVALNVVNKEGTGYENSVPWRRVDDEQIDIYNQKWQYMTELSPWTNSVMQSFYFDNVTDTVYMTQAYGSGYKLSKMLPNGKLLSQMQLDGGGHGTHNGYRWIDGTLWIYSSYKDLTGKMKVVKFTYKPDVTLKYGDRDMTDVFTGHPDFPYVVPLINEPEGLMLYRVEYPKAEWASRDSMNYIEIRKLSDIDNGIDNVLHKMDIPLSLASADTPMQGVAFDAKTLYWYTGKSDPNAEKLLTAFDLESGTKLYQKKVDFGKEGGSYLGDFAEPEGIQLYYDKDTNSKTLLAGMTFGRANQRTHRVYGIFTQKSFDFFTALTKPVTLIETGGRSKSTPTLKNNKLSDVTEPGYYYLQGADLQNVTDFPMIDEMKGEGYFLEVSAPNQGGLFKQTLTRNALSRDIQQFTRLATNNKLSANEGSTNWNFVQQTSIGGAPETIPAFITDMNQFGIVSGRTWYVSASRGASIKDNPIKGTDFTVYVENVNPSTFRVTLTTVSPTTAATIYIAYFSNTSPKRTSPWSNFGGTPKPFDPLNP